MEPTVPSRTLGVMVSSTFYDLKQVRADLRAFIHSIGCSPFISENSEFPVTPEVAAVENCRLRVQRDADILVLVLGTRYGSIDERTGRSIVGIEYLAARQKGIPIYACFDRRLVTYMASWKANPTGPFSHVVDDPRIFEFADDVQRADGVWRAEFDVAADIIDYLRRQFGYLFAEGLDARRLLRGCVDRSWVTELRGEALRMALEKPEGWQFLLFGRVLCDCVQDAQRLRRQHHFELSFARGEDVANPFRWLRGRYGDAGRKVESLKPLLEGWLAQAVQGDGESADPEDIVLAARSFCDFYVSALRWSLRVRSANVPEEFRAAARLIAHTMDDAIHQIEGYGHRVIQLTRLELSKPEAERQPMNLGMRISIDDVTHQAVHDEFVRLTELAESGQLGWSP